MRSFGFQVSVALLGIGLYLFSAVYVGMHAIPFFKARGVYNQVVELYEDRLPRSLAAVEAEEASQYQSAKDSLIRTVGIAFLSLICGACCTVAARRIQARQKDESPAPSSPGADSQ